MAARVSRRRPDHPAARDVSDELLAEIAAFLARGADDPDGFDRLAHRLFARQYERCAPYRAFCDGRDATPEKVAVWRDIPAAPAAAFKRFALCCAREDACVRIFHSSGTTGNETSRHFLDAPALDLYRVSLRAGFRRFVLSDGAALPVLALMPPPQIAPHSSLSFMLGELITDYGGRFFFADGWQRELANVLRRLTHPVVVFGTAFAWVHFFDATNETFALPPGSRVVETGGFKGRSREVARDDLYAAFTSRLGVPPTHCLAEYGMSEMASQFYDANTGIKVGPPWARTRVLDPVTGTDAAPDLPGLLVHVDLANTNSVLAIQTEDWGQADGDGFVLLGRAPGAILRGCSLTAEAFSPTPTPPPG